MNRPLRFEKWEGLGNDFLLVDHDGGDLLSTELTRALCDRHRGIGADGILFVSRAGKTPRMIVLNADGSRPEMCGNGLRCVAGFLAEKMNVKELSLVIATDAGDKHCSIERNESGDYDVTVDMGQAKLGKPLDVVIDDHAYTFATVDVGNPHAITFQACKDKEMAVLGPGVERFVEGGTNVEFCELLDTEAKPTIKVRVWERGVGWTQACGTGACAVAAAACADGKTPYEKPTDVVLPGGPLEIIVSKDKNVRMKGPARRVFRGEVSPR